jgi:hypothetical protein
VSTTNSYDPDQRAHLVWLVKDVYNYNFPGDRRLLKLLGTNVLYDSSAQFSLTDSMQCMACFSSKQYKRHLAVRISTTGSSLGSAI